MESKIKEVTVSSSVGGKVQIVKFEYSQDFHYSMSQKFEVDMTEKEAEEFREQKLMELRDQLEDVADREVTQLIEQRDRHLE